MGITPAAHLVGLTDQIAQHAVDHATQAGGGGSHRLDRLIDHGVRLLRAVFQPMDGNHEEGLVGIRQRLLHQAAQHRFRPAVVTQTPPGQVAHPSPGGIGPLGMCAQ